MTVLIFGATGMVGQGVLRECLLDPGVTQVTTIGRSATGQKNPKLREIVYPDLSNFSSIESQLTGFDACFFCLGISSVGMPEDDYRRVTYGFTMAAAQTLLRLNPHLTFVYVSAKGSDSTEKSKVMWARMRGALENALSRMPFEGVYSLRPGVIQPLHGIKSRTRLYRVGYYIIGAIIPLLERLFPNEVTTTERIGRAMLNLARHGFPKQILESADINRAAAIGLRSAQG
jgi:uncharacterized protein YbjT (DUF2867 family)